MLCAGIDAGSRTIKVVLMDADSLKLIARGVIDQGVRQASLAVELLKRLLNESNMLPEEVKRIIATGYGRNAIDFADSTVTEITCQALGVRRTDPDSMTIVDIGGQDSKIIQLTENGNVRDFAMNDRCAAGAGRFLEVVADRLGIDIRDLGKLTRKSHRPADINSMCVVFAETEITGLLASGTPPESIVGGVQTAIASRLASMAGRNITGPVVFTGGVALVPGMLNALSKSLGLLIRAAKDPQVTAALGAAILSAREHKNKMKL